jgi:hypothetical protein
MSRLPIAALLLVCACGDAGTAPDERTATPVAPEFAARPNPSFQPFSFVVTSCIEPVLVTGTFHQVTRGVPGPDGDPHILFHINAKGTGVGQETGARYQWNDRLFDHSNLVGAETFVLNDHTRLIGQGGAPNIVLHVRAKLTVRPDGTVVLDRFNVIDSCEPS